MLRWTGRNFIGMLQQFILDAVKSPKSDISDAPVESTRHEDHQRQHERLARGSTNVRNTTTTGKTKTLLRLCVLMLPPYMCPHAAAIYVST